MENSLITYLVYYFVLFPIAKVLFINIQYFTSKQEPGEYLVRKLVNWGSISDFIHVVIALSLLGISAAPMQIEHFCLIGWPFIVHWDLPTFVFLAFATVIIAVIGRFSLFYLHRDAYYHKFFSLYFIFQLSLGLIVLSSDTTYLFMGWELLGFSSVLLIAFYEHRTGPLKNAMRILFIYEFGDIFFCSMIVLLLYLNNEDITRLMLIQEHGCTWAMALLIITFFFKSGIFPWIWLPRAMEGPTPSSAVFYGSLSTHIPIFLLLHIWPKEWTLPAFWPEVWTISHPVNIIIIAIVICVISAFITTHMSRQGTDAKNTIAYATVTQLAIIYIEIFFGLYTLALVHAVSHGVYRTFEFLRTPSLLHLYHTMETRRPKTTHTGKHFKALLPDGFRNWLYALTINEFGFFTRSFNFIDRFLGLKFLRYDRKTAKRYTIIVSVVWVVFSIIVFLLDRNFFTVKCIGDGSGNSYMAFIFNWKYFYGMDEILLALAVGFNALCFYNIRKVGMFFVSLTCSAGTVGIEHVLILSRHLNISNLLYCVAIGLLSLGIVALAIISARHSSNGHENHTGYTAKLSRTTLSNLLLFILGLAIVGVPGLGIFVGWECLSHWISPFAPHIVVKGFFIIKFNTLLVFLFYFSNFLGFPEHEVQVLHHYKLDTLHLRWVQKHL